jgi:hypothetical protein
VDALAVLVGGGEDLLLGAGAGRVMSVTIYLCTPAPTHR